MREIFLVVVVATLVYVFIGGGSLKDIADTYDVVCGILVKYYVAGIRYIGQINAT